MGHGTRTLGRARRSRSRCHAVTRSAPTATRLGRVLPRRRDLDGRLVGLGISTRWYVGRRRRRAVSLAPRRARAAVRRVGGRSLLSTARRHGRVPGDDGDTTCNRRSARLRCAGGRHLRADRGSTASSARHIALHTWHSRRWSLVPGRTGRHERHCRNARRARDLSRSGARRTPAPAARSVVRSLRSASLAASAGCSPWPGSTSTSTHRRR